MGVEVEQQVLDYTANAGSVEGGYGQFEPAARNSAVVVDIDRAMTRVFLFDLVEDTPRFVGFGASESTLLPPYSDTGIGVASAFRVLEVNTGRRLLDGEHFITPQQPNGDGADIAYVTGLPVSPIRAALISDGSSPLSRLLVGAARRTSTILADSGADLAHGTDELSPAALRQWLLAARPATIVLALASESFDEWDLVLDAVADVARDLQITQGIVVADDAHQQRAAGVLGAIIELSGINPGDYQAQEIASAVEAELRDAYLRQVDAMPGLKILANATFVDRIQAGQAVTAFLHRHMGRDVLAVACGTGTLFEAAIRGDGIAALRADLDLTVGVSSLLRIAPDLVTRWLPFRSSSEEIYHWVLNRALRPFTVLESRADTQIAAAFKREILANLCRETGVSDRPTIDLIAADLGLEVSDTALAALTLLDGIMPNPSDGVVSLALDTEHMLSALGALATGDPAFAREVIAEDFLAPLATCIVVNGSGTDGSLAVRGELRRGDGEPTRFSVPFGSIQRFSLGESETAALTLSPEPGFSIGARASGELVTFEGETQLFGGELGLIIDARGRPFTLPGDPEARVARLKSWMTDLGGRVD